MSPLDESRAQDKKALEVRYLVVKLSDLTNYTKTNLRNYFEDNAIPTRDCVVVEADWPIYDEVVEKVLNQ